MAEKKKQSSPKKPANSKAKEESSVVKAREDKFAVIETGGKQYKVSVGDVLSIEKLTSKSKGEYKEGDKIIFDKVMLVDNGKDTTIGTPYVAKAQVEAEFQEEGRGKKVHILKFKQKSRYSVKKGHRQPYTKVKITSIK